MSYHSTFEGVRLIPC